MKIKKALFVPGKSSFYFDDQLSIKANATHDGFIYEGELLTEGFKTVRQAGECISIVLVLENGLTAVGDCTAVQYSGASGRDPLFIAENYIPFLQENIAPKLEQLELYSFKEAASFFEKMKFDGQIMHTAIRYGLSQALLDACALSQHRTKCEVICQEYNLPIDTTPIPIFGQSGDDRYHAVDKMILKGVSVLPHALINNVQDKLGYDGKKLKEYLKWLVKRVWNVGGMFYKPTIHIDVYGTIGDIFEGKHINDMVDYIASLEDITVDFPLYVEGPVDMHERAAQVEVMGLLKRGLEKKGSQVKIVADEWCNTLEDIKHFTDNEACHMIQIKTPDLGGIQNTIEAVLYCKEYGMEAYQGGTCNETEVSTRTCVHAAMATHPTRTLAKPGMGFDEGFMIVNNEMQRLIAILESKGDV